MRRYHQAINITNKVATCLIVVLGTTQVIAAQVMDEEKQTLKETTGVSIGTIGVSLISGLIQYICGQRKKSKEAVIQQLEDLHDFVVCKERGQIWDLEKEKKDELTTLTHQSRTFR